MFQGGGGNSKFFRGGFDSMPSLPNTGCVLGHKTVLHTDFAEFDSQAIHQTRKINDLYRFIPKGPTGQEAS
jgi:hypothetical protein